DLEDAPLRPGQLDQQRVPGLQRLAEIAAALPQVEVLGHLLADGAAAADAAAAGVVFEGAVDGVEVEAAVRGEFLDLGGDQGDGELRRNLLPVTPFVAQTETVFADALDMPRQHEGAGDRKS